MRFTILSALAEGADRLVAYEILNRPGSKLQVVLPSGKADYSQDFKTPESIVEFEALLSRAQCVKEIPPPKSRTEAYAQVGRYVVDHCDVLIALWGGKRAAGQGGTADIVQYARKMRCPLFWIRTIDPLHVSKELGTSLTHQVS